MPASDVKEGKDESENEIIKVYGKLPKFDFKPKDYLEIGENLDIIDVKRAAKVSGSRFGFIKNEAALLEFALVQFVFDFLVDEKNIKDIIKERKLSIDSKTSLASKLFIPIVPPVMIKDENMRAMGYLEHGGEGETYHFEKDKLYLVGTSEQSVGPMHKDEILKEAELPKRYIAFSPCFRREAGSYGKDVRGILRVHQFDKLEMFSFCRPEESDQEHELFLGIEETLVQALKIPYRVVKMCTGDLGNPKARLYDLECWMPGQKEYRETHSTASCTDFQARRLNIKYKDKKSNTKFVHTLNGTAFAIGRILIAIIENYQTKEGSMKVPEVLKKYTCGLSEIKRK
jgi:seryl-tRNA synthetase